MYKNSVLNESIKVGSLTLKNRLIVAPMTMNYAVNGEVTDRLIRYYETRAKGGFGAIIIEAAMIDERVQYSPYSTAMWADEHIENQAKLAAAVKKHGCAAILQINHNGRQLGVAPGEEEKNVGPSAVPCTLMNIIPHVLTVDEIHEIVEMFSEAALRAKKAGYDGVEIHGAHGYLVCEFMSPYSNKRVDEYGGSIDNRMRFPLEIVKAVKEKCGQEFPLFFRISADEHVPGGLKIEETMIMARMLEAAGVDCIDVSSSNYGSMVTYVPPMNLPYCTNAPSGAAIKKVVNIPVSVVGHVTDPRLAESMIMLGQADIVSIGRASIADPELPNKLFEGRPQEIRQCLSCSQGCVAKTLAGAIIECMTNPNAGYEYLDETKPAEIKKKVVVVGGGVAGILAAEGAALKGHSVTLYEKSGELGGAFLAASIPPEKGQLSNLLSWHIAEIKKLGVNIKLNALFTEKEYEEENADKVIIATGTNPAVPPIEGIHGSNVLHAADVLQGKVRAGHKVVIAGGGLVGAETATFLSAYNHDVTIVEMKPDIAVDEEFTRRILLMKMIREQGIKVLTNAPIQKMTENHVVVKYNGEEMEIACDSIVLAMGVKTDTTIWDVLKEKENVVFVGNGTAPANALLALRQGYEAGIYA